MGDKHYSSGGGGISFGTKSVAAGRNSTVTVNSLEGESQHPVSAAATGEGEDTEQPLTIGGILKSLEPGQLWGALVAAATVIGGAFLAGQKLHMIETTPTTPPSTGAIPAATGGPIPCSEMPDWPQGRWWQWGHLDTPPTKENTDDWKRIPQISPELIFVSSHSFEGYTDEHTANARNTVYRANLNDNETLRAGGPTVHYHGGDRTGFTTEGKISAAADGCVLEGDFVDSSGNRGTLHLLYMSARYYVLPDREEHTERSDR